MGLTIIDAGWSNTWINRMTYSIISEEYHIGTIGIGFSLADRYKDVSIFSTG